MLITAKATIKFLRKTGVAKYLKNLLIYNRYIIYTNLTNLKKLHQLNYLQKCKLNRLNLYLNEF
jgi:hypothetical protein